MDNLEQKIKKLKYIIPDKEFKTRTKIMILNESQNFSFVSFLNHTSLLQRITAGVSFVALIFLPMIIMRITSPSLSSLKDTEKLSTEVSLLPVNIELKEINYHKNNSEIITAALSEVDDTNVRHLKEGIIQSEIETLTPKKDNNKEIEDLFKKVIL